MAIRYLNFILPRFIFDCIRHASPLALALCFADTSAMNEVSDLKVRPVPKWPFWLLYVILLAAAYWVVRVAAHPISETVGIIVASVVVVGAILCALPYYWDYKAMGRLIDADAVATVAGQMADIKKYSDQITVAADQWARVQEATKGSADKTVAAAGQIADRMASEIREFNEFQAKLNDAEKNALRLEVEKLRRAEGEWLQVVARILDHIFSLHTAAVRSGQPELAEQIGHFQNACRDAARRVGLTPFGVEPNEKFDPKKHRAQDVENPAAGTLIAGLVGPGMTFQGRLIRPALVRLAVDQETSAPAAAAEVETKETTEAGTVEPPPQIFEETDAN